MPLPCPTHQELSKWRPAAVLVIHVCRLLAPPTAAVSINGSGTPVPVNLVSLWRDDVGFVDVDEDAVIGSLMSSQFQR